MGPPQTELTNYIWTYLQQGYALGSIKDQLIAQGYEKKAINAAVDYVYAHYYYSKQPGSPQQPRYVTAQPHFSATHHVLLFVIILFGIGLLATAMVLLFASSAPTNSHTTPQNTPGNSQTDTTDTTNGNVDAANNGNTEETTSNNGENTPEIKPPITTGNNVPIVLEDPATYNPSKTYSKRQLDSIIESTAPSNSQEALKFCTEYPTAYEQDYCTSTVAEYSANIELCGQIERENIKDDCYLKIVLDENADGTYCNNIQNAYKKENCMKFIEALNAREANRNVELPERNPEDAVNYYAVQADFSATEEQPIQ